MPSQTSRAGLRRFLVGGYGGAWVGPADFDTPYASMSLRAIGASAGVGIIVVLGAEACGLTESARIARLPGRPECGPVRAVCLRSARPSPKTWPGWPGASSEPA